MTDHEALFLLIAGIDHSLTRNTAHYRDHSGRLLQHLDQVVDALLTGNLLTGNLLTSNLLTSSLPTKEIVNVQKSIRQN